MQLVEVRRILWQRRRNGRGACRDERGQHHEGRENPQQNKQAPQGAGQAANARDLAQHLGGGGQDIDGYDGNQDRQEDGLTGGQQPAHHQQKGQGIGDEGQSAHLNYPIRFLSSNRQQHCPHGCNETAVLAKLCSRSFRKASRWVAIARQIAAICRFSYCATRRQALAPSVGHPSPTRGIYLEG